MRATPTTSSSTSTSPTVAVARLLLGPRMRVQAPPNLVRPASSALLLARRRRRLGRRLAADPRPRQPRAALAARSTTCRARPPRPGSSCASGSPPTREYVRAGEPWLDPRVRPHVAALADPARAWPTAGVGPGRAAVAGAGRAATTRSRPPRRPHRPAREDRHRRAAPATGAATSTRSTATGRRCGDAGRPARPRRPRAARRRRARRAAAAPRDDPAALAATHEPPRSRSSTPTAPALEALARSPTTCAATPSATTSPTSSTGTSTSPTSATPAAGSARSRSGAPTPTRTRSRSTRSPTASTRRGTLGATEVCMQGGIHPDLPGTAYFDLARAVKGRAPGMHLHAFSPMEVVNGAARSGLSSARLAGRGARRPGSTRSRAPRPRSSTTTSAGC